MKYLLASAVLLTNSLCAGMMDFSDSIMNLNSLAKNEHEWFMKEHFHDIDALTQQQKKEFTDLYKQHTLQADQYLFMAEQASQCCTQGENDQAARDCIQAVVVTTQVKGARAKAIAAAISILSGYIANGWQKYWDVKSYLLNAQYNEEMALFYFNLLNGVTPACSIESGIQ
jgi:hypothetical protein